ncbi:MAG: hypothetical protein LBC90_00370 [Candidatus Adiutrix sp.]|nr:hypothetical protein [Candidatus Adiutrix sp.]
MRNLGRRFQKGWSATLRVCFLAPPRVSPRLSAVEKVARNALAEMIGRARSLPQRGQAASANPAYVALAELTAASGRPGLALGLRYETGEITFLDFDRAADKEEGGEAFVGRKENLTLWRRLEELIINQVNRTMVGPRRPIRPPEEVEYEN